MITEQEYVRRCLRDICRKNGFSDSTAMTQRNFEMLSDEIRSKTEILLSISTLKRLLNGEFSRMPQQTTLNTISGYLGYSSWQDYKNSISQHEEKPRPSLPLGGAVDRGSLINWNRIVISFI